MHPNKNQHPDRTFDTTKEGFLILSRKKPVNHFVKNENPSKSVIVQPGWMGLPVQESDSHPMAAINLTAGLALTKKEDGSYAYYLQGLDLTVCFQNIFKGNEEIHP